MYILVVVIAVVLSSAVSIVLHQMGKNQNSMEKIRHYANKRQEEFDVYFKSQAEKLTDNSSALETKQIQAVAAVKRLQQQYEDFEKLSKNLEEQIQAVNNIGVRISDYDKIVQNLMEMTVAVEQNLQKVKNEAGIVDKLNSRLDVQQKTVDTIERKIPEITKKFSASNTEQLQSIGTNLLDEYEKRAAEIKNITQNAVEQQQNIMAKIRSDIDAAYSEAVEKAQDIQNRAFDTLIADTKKRSDACLKELTVSTKQLSVQLNDQIKQSKNQMDADFASFENAIKEHKDALDSEFRTRSAEINSSLTERFRNLGEDYEKVKNDFSQLISGRTDEIAAEIQEKTSGIENQLKQKTEALDSLLLEKTSSLSEEIRMKTDALDSAINTQSEDYDLKLNQKFSALNASLNEKTDLLDGEIKQRTQSLYTNLSETVTDYDALLNSKIETLTSSLNEKSSALENAILEKTQALGTSLADSTGNLDSVFGKKISDLNLELETKTSAMEQEYTRRIDELNSNLAESTQNYDSQLNETLTSLSTALSERSDALDAAIRQKSEALNADLLENAHNYETLLNEKMETAAQKLEEKVKYLDEQIELKTQAVDNEVKTQTQDYTGLVQQRLDAIAADMNQKTDDLAKDVAEKTDTIESEMRLRINAINTELAEKSHAINVVFSEKTHSYEDTVKARIDELNAALTQYKNTADAKTESLRKEFEEVFTEAKKAAEILEQQTRQNAERFEVLQNSSDEQKNLLEEKFNNLYETTIAKADEQETAAYQKFQKLSELHLDKYKTDAQQRVDEMQSVITGTISELKKKTETAQVEIEESLQSIKTKCDDTMALSQSTAEKISDETIANAKNLEQIQEQLKQQLVDFDNSLAREMKEISADYDAKQTKYLAGLDKQLEEYKDDLEYRFTKISDAGSEIDKLESNLRKLMDSAQNHVLSDFQKFSGAQQKQQQEFEESIQANSSELKLQLDTLEKNLDELRQQAYGNVSARLKVFEDEFTGNLKKREDLISEELNTWKNKFDTQLELFTSEYEQNRRNIEIKYGEEVKKRIAEIQGKTSEQLNVFNQQIQDAQGNVQEQINTVGQNLQNFIEQYKIELKATTEEADKFLKQETQNHNTRVVEQIARNEKDLGDQILAFRQAMNDRQETNTATIDAAIQEFNTWKKRMSQQYDETSTLFEDQISQLSQKNTQQIDDMITKNDETSSKLAAEIKALTDDAHEAIAGYESKSSEVMNQLKQMYAQMVSSTQKTIDETMTQTDKDIKALKKEFKEVSDNDRINYRKTIDKLNDDTNELQLKIDDINKGIAKFVAQTGLFEKTDQLKKQLDGSIAELKEELAKTSTYEDKLNSLANQFKLMEKLNDEVNQKLSRFAQEKGHIDGIEQNFKRLIALSNSMDAKIAELNSTSDDLQNVQITVRNFQETLADVSSRYDRIEKKGETVDRVALDVDRSFENLKALEAKIMECNRQVLSLPNEIKSVQSNVDSLLKSGPRIKDAIDKLESLQTILDNADERIEKVTNSRDGIANAEERILKLYKDADEKVKILQTIAKQEVSSQKGAPKQSSINPQLRETVIQLKRAGWNIAEIAKAVKRTESEVDLIIQMEK